MDRLRDADTQSDLIRATPQRAGLQDHEPGFNSNSHTRLEEPRRQTLGAFEGRATLEVPRTWPEREDRRHTLDALGVREPTAELTRRSPEQGQSQFSTHTEEAQTEAERAAEAGREAQREAQRSAPREPERPIIPESPEPSPAPALYDDELFVPQGVDDILAEPDRLKPAISNGATPKANHLTDRSHTPSAETIYKMAARRAKDNPTSGPSRPAPTTTPADASRRAFIDRQQDAQRVSPISQSDVQSADRSRTLRSRKRTNEAVEDSDEEFAQDDRTVNIADRRAQKPNKSPAKRRRTEPSTQEPSSSTTHPPAAPRAPSEIPSPNPPRPSQPATQQQVGMEQPYRRRWTTEQTNGLIKYIEETGPKWAVIKAADNARPEAMGGNLFKHRSNVQLKDKARNLKKHFIKYVCHL